MNIIDNGKGTLRIAKPTEPNLAFLLKDTELYSQELIVGYYTTPEDVQAHYSESLDLPYYDMEVIKAQEVAEAVKDSIEHPVADKELWLPNQWVESGQVRQDPIDLNYYEVIKGKSHMTQKGWEPSLTPSCWVRWRDPDPEVIEDWIQPTGAHDAYYFGDKVKHSEKVWVSNVADAEDGSPLNVWEPGVYGWDEVEPETPEEETEEQE